VELEVEDNVEAVLTVDVDVLVMEAVDDVVNVLVLDVVDVTLLVVVEEEVVDTDVVALEVSVEVTVVDGDVISHPWNVPASCFLTSSFRAAANSARKDSPVPSESSSMSTSKITCTLPLKSMRQPTSNTLPPALPPAKSVTSLVNAASPTAVTARQEVALPDKSMML
jgi:hypothetical protein